ncbi:MAG: hypothetical protein LBP59_20800, partial [Planctomycetaceae bacterium]|nr:hypothetical protein [Planctomycetaceae bacterium]
AVAIGGLKAAQCFTAETQVVIDDKIRDKVYFTETTEHQSFDEVNILFTFAGLSSAFVATAIASTIRIDQKSIVTLNNVSIPIKNFFRDLCG